MKCTARIIQTEDQCLVSGDFSCFNPGSYSYHRHSGFLIRSHWQSSSKFLELLFQEVNSWLLRITQYDPSPLNSTSFDHFLGSGLLKFALDSDSEIKNEPTEGCLYCSVKVKTENQTDLTGSNVEIIEVSRGCENESQDDKQNVKRIEERFESGLV